MNVCESLKAGDKSLHKVEPGSAMTVCSIPAGRVLPYFPLARFGIVELVGDPPMAAYVFCATCAQRRFLGLNRTVSKALGDANRERERERQEDLVAELEGKGVLR